MKLKALKTGKEATRDINITPLIDIVLVLLIIFMVITPITIQEMSVNLPDKTETVEQDDLPKDQLVAAVCEDGTVALNRKVMALDDLSKAIRRRIRGKSKKVIFVDGHPDATYTARDAGVERIGLASLKTPDEFRACAPSEPPPTGDPLTEGTAIPSEG